MTISIWRYCHLLLAVFSALFLVVASLTGLVLAFEPISDSLQPYAIDGVEKVSVAEIVPVLQSEYDEVLEFEVTASDFIVASVITKEGISEIIYIHPKTAKKIGNVEERAPVFNWTTNLHRSLFLKSIGRFFIGLASLLLCLIAVTGLLLLVKRQGGVLKLYSKVQETGFMRRYHVLLGRWFLVPVIIIAATGVYLSAEKFSLLPDSSFNHDWNAIPSDVFTKQLPIKEFPLFQNLTLNEVRKFTFPFSKDSEDYYQLSLRDKEVLVHQYTGEVMSEVPYPFVQLASRWSLHLHTGQGSVIWSLVLLVASISILFFIYSGFFMTFKRMKKTKSSLVTFDKDECEYIILVGSETGNTYAFAKAFYQALIDAGKKVNLSSLNKYATYQKAKYLVVFTSTYGDGDAPSNARNFNAMLTNFDPVNEMQFSVVGFGSLAYPHYCRFAIAIDALLHRRTSFTPVLPLVKVDEQSHTTFKNWVNQWSEQLGLSLKLTLPESQNKNEKKQLFKVIERTNLNSDYTFLLRLRPKKGFKFQSGD
ncbi:MAG: PepSY domain-containing protein [Flavobacteriaceae bacterium]|nr:PepSY domain-containing protein [Flavobacteriaceae bacterium]